MPSISDPKGCIFKVSLYGSALGAKFDVTIALYFDARNSNENSTALHLTTISVLMNL